ncbi:hypothetical protein K501DRAFT_269837 [Backusella circina FSU 941]|nr:hypothetical protein K501DRAFT_269837 [Backusella circina FSU 941]
MFLIQPSLFFVYFKHEFLLFKYSAFQLIFSLPILIKALVNIVSFDQAVDSQTQYIYGHLESSTVRLINENILYILYSVWKLWIIVEGLWAQSSRLTDVSREDLRVQNIYLYMLHTLVTCIIFIPSMIAAYKTAKAIGWQVYKKVGVNVSLQRMYHEAQWFTLSLKIDMFFQATLLICAATASRFVYAIVICALLAVVNIFSLLISRLAIAKESHWMILVMLFKYSTVWATGVIYAFLSMFSIIFTSVLAIRCQFNYKHGLQKHVQLDFYSLMPLRQRQSSVGSLLAFNRPNSPIEDDAFDQILTPIDTKPLEIQPVLLQKVTPNGWDKKLDTPNSDSSFTLMLSLFVSFRKVHLKVLKIFRGRSNFTTKGLVEIPFNNAVNRDRLESGMFMGWDIQPLSMGKSDSVIVLQSIFGYFPLKHFQGGHFFYGTYGITVHRIGRDGLLLRGRSLTVEPVAWELTKLPVPYEVPESL